MKKFVLMLAVSVLALSLISCRGATRPGTDDGGGQVISNAVIFVTFGGTAAYDGAEASARVSSFNTSPTGINAFFLAESLGKCNVTSTYCGSVSIADSADFFRARSWSNPQGYSTEQKDGKPHVDCFYREQMLVRMIVEQADFPEGFNPDSDGDGIVDGITFVFDESFTSSTSAPEKIMWPHKSEFYGFFEDQQDFVYVPDGYFEEVDCNVQEAFSIPTVNGKQVGSYAVLSTSSTEGEFCHEFSHVLGLPDYYSYVSDRRYYDNVGGFDLMGAEVGEQPQFSLAYVRSKLGWLEEGKDILVTDKSAQFNLHPVTEGGVQAVKIIPPDFAQKGEFFMVEVRRKETGRFDSAVNSTGVVIYSVRPEYAYIASNGSFTTVDYGNMYGNGRFEVKLFLGNSLLNYFTADEENNALRDITYRDGTPANVSVTDITEKEDGSFSFGVSVGERPSAESVTHTHRIADGKVLTLRWEPETNGKTHVMVIRDSLEASACYITNTLPSGKSVAVHDGEGLDVISAVTLSSLSREYIPAVREGCYVLLVHEGEDGRLYGYTRQRLVLEGQQPIVPQFGDFVSALMRPGKPLRVALVAFIACCGFIVLCVLVGIIVKSKRKKGQGIGK